jgi:RNA polymerase sigma-70 factor (TIGR02943 family)
MNEHTLNPNLWNVAYRDYLIRFALMRVSDYGTAEDLVQEAFLSGWNGRRHFRGDCSERTWLTGILRNKIIDHYRKTGRRPAILATDLENSFSGESETRSWIDEQPDDRLNHRPGAETERKEFMEELELAVSRLPDKMGEAFRMREILGCSTDEITRELKISKANLWVLIHRAKQILSSELSENWDGVESFGGRMAA